MRKFLVLLILAAPIVATAAVPPLDDATRQLTRDIYKQLVEIDTTESVGNMTTAAEAMAARLRGTGQKKPILLLAHLDVVEYKTLLK